MHYLSIKNLKKNYDGKHIVSGISMDVKSREIIGLLGPNGAGKTTTFYMILGLIAPDDGVVVLDGENLNNFPMYMRARKGISYLPQEPSIFRKLSVEDNIRSVLEIAGVKGQQQQERLESVLEEFNLFPFAKRFGYQLSGGERRKVEIARSIALNPFFILLDEPFAGIDPISITDLKKTIVQLKKDGIGLIITDHNVREALSITDRAYIISGGGIFAHGTPSELIADESVKKTYLGVDFKL